MGMHQDLVEGRFEHLLLTLVFIDFQTSKDPPPLSLAPYFCRISRSRQSRPTSQRSVDSRITAHVKRLARSAVSIVLP